MHCLRSNLILILPDSLATIRITLLLPEHWLLALEAAVVDQHVAVATGAVREVVHGLRVSQAGGATGFHLINIGVGWGVRESVGVGVIGAGIR